jgi:hypothetical protein
MLSPSFHDAQAEIFHDTHEILIPEDPIFHDAKADLLLDDGHLFDPLDSNETCGFISWAFHLSLHQDAIIDSMDVDRFLMDLDHAELRGEQEDFNSFTYVSRAVIQDHAQHYVEYLGYYPVDII